jgi:hypothetical protein
MLIGPPLSRIGIADWDSTACASPSKHAKMKISRKFGDFPMTTTPGAAQLLGSTAIAAVQ